MIERTDKHQALAKTIYEGLKSLDRGVNTPYVQDADRVGDDFSHVTVDGYLDLYAVADAILKAFVVHGPFPPDCEHEFSPLPVPPFPQWPYCTKCKAHIVKASSDG